MEAGTANTHTRSAPIMAARVRRGLGVFWSLYIFILRDFLRSPWVALDWLILVAVQTLFFQYRSGQSHLFGIEYAMVVVLAAITTQIIFSRAGRAQTYPILARPLSRATYVGAAMLVSWSIAVTGHLLSAAVEAIRFSPWLTPGAAPMAWRNPATYINSSVPVLVVAAFTVALVALLSTFVSASGTRLGAIAVLALLVMSFDSRNFPIEAVRPLLERMPPVLAPIAGALKYATESQTDSVATLSLAVLAAYTVALVIAVLLLSTSRELILD